MLNKSKFNDSKSVNFKVKNNQKASIVRRNTISNDQTKKEEKKSPDKEKTRNGQLLKTSSKSLIIALETLTNQAIDLKKVTSRNSIQPNNSVSLSKTMLSKKSNNTEISINSSAKLLNEKKSHLSLNLSKLSKEASKIQSETKSVANQEV